jgi:class 3 adenylate cyclase
VRRIPRRHGSATPAAGRLEEQPAEQFRRRVTILFSDVVDSTGLGERVDPETLHRVLTEYFEGVKPVVEAHGGTLAKFIGDAVMAVFGLTELHEDDALRAVRAAVEMRDTLARLNEGFEQRYGISLLIRTGINTGTVAGAGVAPERNFVSGDTANTAARLQQNAGPGEIVLGESTFKLVCDLVETERLELEFKGKQQAIAAHRLVSVAERSDARHGFRPHSSAAGTLWPSSSGRSSGPSPREVAALPPSSAPRGSASRGSYTNS